MLIFVLYLVDLVAVVSCKHLIFRSETITIKRSLRCHKREMNYQCMQQWNKMQMNKQRYKLTVFIVTYFIIILLLPLTCHV